MDGQCQNCQMLACDSTCEVALLSFRISGCKVLTAAEGYIQVTSLVKSSGYSPVTQMVRVNHQNSSKVELQQQEAYLKWRKRWGRLGAYLDFVQRHASLDAELVGCGRQVTSCCRVASRESRPGIVRFSWSPRADTQLGQAPTFQWLLTKKSP